MNINVTIQENNSEYELGHISLINNVPLLLSDLSIVLSLIKANGGGEWLDNATIFAYDKMDNCTKKLIREAEAELIKAKKFMKDNYPTKYKWSFIKLILKNPIKTVIAKCLLKSKYKLQ